MVNIIQGNVSALVGLDTATLRKWLEMAGATYPKLSEWSNGLKFGTGRGSAANKLSIDTIQLAHNELATVYSVYFNKRLALSGTLRRGLVLKHLSRVRNSTNAFALDSKR
jgi:hypothetical protein